MANPSCPICGVPGRKHDVRSRGQRYRCYSCGRNYYEEDQSNASRFSHREEGNTLTITRKGEGVPSRIKTLADLLSAVGYDPDEWAVSWWEGNSWEMATKDKKTNLEWNDGKVSGSIERNPGMVPITLFQVKARFVRRDPVEVNWPVVKPVRIASEVVPSSTKGDGLQTAMFITDTHWGFVRDMKSGKLEPLHDRKALHVALQVAEAVKPDIIIHGGDGWDLAEWSTKFAKSPEMYWTTQPAFEEGAWWLSQFRRHCREMVFIPGNHDNRLPLYLQDQAIAACGLEGAKGIKTPPVEDLRHWIPFDDLDIQVVEQYPHGRYWINDNVMVIHSTVSGGDPIKEGQKLLQTHNCSVVHGHTHRQAIIPDRREKRDRVVTYYAFAAGTLGRTDGALPGSKANDNWQNGFGLIHFEPGNGLHHIEPVQIYGDRAVFRNQVFKGLDLSSTIASDTGWESLKAS